MSSDTRRAPLAGIRVIEIANFVAGPIATALMADMGADVIKVEPPGGDPTRVMRMRGDFAPTANHHFHTLNRGKRSVTVDLSTPGAAEVVSRLAADADVLVTNLVTDRLRRYGIEYSAVRATNPDIVFAQLTGWGSSGPGSDRPGFDSTAYWAGSGLMSLMGEVGTPAVANRSGQGDYPTGLALLTAVLAALRVRDQTGEAQFVDITLQRSGLWGLGTETELVLNNPQYHPARLDRMAATIAIRNSYQTADGRWIMLAMHNSAYWRQFCSALGRPEWSTDPRYVGPVGELLDQSALIPEIDRIFRGQDLQYWSDSLDRHGCIWSAAVTLEEVTADEQLRAQGAFQRVDYTDDEGHSVALMAAPFSIRTADVYPRRRGPRLGEHTMAVLLEAGFSLQEVSDIAARGILG